MNGLMKWFTLLASCVLALAVAGCGGVKSKKEVVVFWQFFPSSQVAGQSPVALAGNFARISTVPYVKLKLVHCTSPVRYGHDDGWCLTLPSMLKSPQFEACAAVRIVKKPLATETC